MKTTLFSKACKATTVHTREGHNTFTSISKIMISEDGKILLIYHCTYGTYMVQVYNFDKVIKIEIEPRSEEDETLDQ